ncbi:MAG: lipopolysaccharide biosynthesis protein [Pseudomonas sp.]|uniref:lipopolysaccharide biosynthesis protein n=1 Tax=Pseudomonas sp. TaxID=306 RepID=UPI003D0B8A85
MKKNSATLLRMLMLYGGKTSSLLVAFVFLPLYGRVLGEEQFGTIVVIISLQALLVMLDLGMSTLASREAAITTKGSGSLLKMISSAEIILSVFYIGLVFLFFLIKLVFEVSNISWSVIVFSALLFFFLALQNLYYTVLLARQKYILGSTIQIAGVMVRAAITVYVLVFISASVEAFVLTQAVLAFIHFLVSRAFCLGELSSICPTGGAKANVAEILSVAKTGGALVLFSAAGAAVLQLDKPIISALSSTASVAPYYLASLLCMTPISILASPISQYFQPMVIREMTMGQDGSAMRVIRKFVLSTFLIVALPTLVLWLFREQIIGVWLGENPSNVLVSRYLEILLPGVAIGALGFIPYSLLLYARDFRFQATLSATLTVVTLMLTAMAAVNKNIEAICFVYSAYHVLSTLSSWIRAGRLPETKISARNSAITTLKLLLLFSLLFSVVGFMFFER